jgi:hypothetical protein
VYGLYGESTEQTSWPSDMSVYGASKRMQRAFSSQYIEVVQAPVSRMQPLVAWAAVVHKASAGIPAILRTKLWGESNPTA